MGNRHYCLTKVKVRLVMLQDLWVNVIANLIATLIFAILGLASYVAIFVTERQGLLRFFGVSNKLPRVHIYLSRLEIKPGGTVGFEPITKGYSGPSINKIEFEGALLIRNQLRSATLALLPKKLRDWLSQQHVSLIALDPAIDTSPQDLRSVAFDNMVVLGSSIYNRVAKRYLEDPSCHFCFAQKDDGERVIKIKAGGLKDVEIPGRSSGRDLAILQRIYDKEHGNTVFLCSGLGASATFGSVRYLAENWKELYRKYECAEFALCLAFPGQAYDSEAVVNPVIVYEVTPVGKP